MHEKFWQGKRVLIIGHTGFKGTWLTFWLCKLGAKVTGYALDPVEGSCFNELDFGNLQDIRGDVRDAASISDAFSKATPDIVFHLATPTFVPESFKDPALTFDVNVMGLVSTLECVRKFDTVRATLVVTSDKVYKGDCPPSGFAENEELFGALDPYSSSKTCQELIVETYRNSFLSDRGIATARASNVLGGGDPIASRLIPSIIDALLKDETVKIRNPLFIRPWQNILDCLDGYLTLAQCLFENNSYNGAWNFGPNPENIMTVEQITQKLCEFWGNGVSYEITSNRTPLLEKDILKLSIEKAKTQLGFSPKWSLEQTLAQIVDYYKTLASGQNIQNAFNANIEAHMNKVDDDEEQIAK